MLEVIFDDEKLKGVKTIVGVLSSVIPFLIQINTKDPVVMVVYFQLLLIFLFMYVLAKFFLYSKKENIWTVVKYMLGLMALVIVLIYSTTMV